MRIAWAAAVALAAALAGCARESHPEPKVESASPPRARLTLLPADAPRAPAASNDAAVLHVEVVAEPVARHRGLGGRDRLPEDGGMLFAYPSAEPRKFWMKDCLIALDIAFVDSSARIVRLVTLPRGEGRPDADLPYALCQVPVPFVIETEAGWFERHSVGVGDRVDLSAAMAGVVPK